MKDNIVVITIGSLTYSGVILSYNNYGYNGENDRYIEFTHDEKSAGNGYGYCKEKLDGVDSIEIFCAAHGTKFEEDFERSWCPDCEEILQDSELKRLR